MSDQNGHFTKSSKPDISRKQHFDQIKEAIAPHVSLSSSSALVGIGDSLKLLRQFPDHSVSLILTDPPYHSTKKRNICGDRAFELDDHYLEWMAQYAVEWRRILKMNGSLFCFCDSSMSARLDVLFSKNFNMLSHVVWTKPNDPGFDGWKGKMNKEALRQWYPHSERILFAEPASDGNLFRCPLGILLSKARKQSGMTMKELTGIIGAHGRVNHGGAVSNWEEGRNTPSREQYEGMRQALLATGRVPFMPVYEDAVRVFSMDADKEFTDVWTFPSVRPYKGKHPAEKPIAMLEHAIGATTLPGDIVVDCFAGSGSTAIASLGFGRRVIAIEIEKAWGQRIVDRIRDCNFKLPVGTEAAQNNHAPAKRRISQLALFSPDK